MGRTSWTVALLSLVVPRVKESNACSGAVFAVSNLLDVGEGGIITDIFSKSQNFCADWSCSSKYLYSGTSDNGPSQ